MWIKNKNFGGYKTTGFFYILKARTPFICNAHSYCAFILINIILQICNYML